MLRFFFIATAFVVAAAGIASAQQSTSGPALIRAFTFTTKTSDGITHLWALSPVQHEKLVRHLSDGTLRTYYGRRVQSKSGAVVFITCPQPGALTIDYHTDTIQRTGIGCDPGPIDAYVAKSTLQTTNFSNAQLTTIGAQTRAYRFDWNWSQYPNAVSTPGS